MRNPLVVSLTAGLLGGGLVLLAAGQPWGSPGPPVPTVSGDDIDPVGSLVSSLGAVVLLGAIVVAVTRTVGRRLAGAVVVLAAAATGYVTVTAAAAWSPWRVAVLAGAVLGAVGGGLAAARGHRWAAMSSRYDAPSAARPAHESDPWKALDRGDDPTL
jgi:O-antigen ligase